MMKQNLQVKQALFVFLLSLSITSWSQSTIKEYSKTFKTYPFSDPDPVARLGAIYPYFRFDGYSDKPVDKAWKVVQLENDFIQVMILPEIGGKIWSAIEKSTGKPFIYSSNYPLIHQSICVHFGIAGTKVPPSAFSSSEFGGWPAASAF